MAKRAQPGFELTSEQLKALGPLIAAGRRVNIVGVIQGKRLSVAFLACNAAFNVAGEQPRKG